MSNFPIISTPSTIHPPTHPDDPAHWRRLPRPIDSAPSPDAGLTRADRQPIRAPNPRPSPAPLQPPNFTIIDMMKDRE